MEADNNNNMSEKDIEKVVELAVAKAIDKFYVEIGKSVVKKGLWLLGIIAVSVALWVTGGHVPR